MATFAQLVGELKAQLNGIAAKLIKDLPVRVANANRQQVEILKQENAESRAHKAPDIAPDFSLPNQDYDPINLNEYLAKGPVILSFYRGRWCPYCNLELRALQRQLDAFKELGASLFAISAQTVEITRSFASEVPLKFQVLSDKGSRVARQYGLVYKLNDDYSQALSSLGVDLKGDQGGGDDYRDELPIPATYIVAPSGKIVYAFIDADFTKRASPAELIDILKQLQQGVLN